MDDLSQKNTTNDLTDNKKRETKRYAASLSLIIQKKSFSKNLQY
jgi:hypothetical protein